MHSVVVSDVEAEKQAKAHLEAVEGFNSANLKHASTQEKIILPAKEGLSEGVDVITPVVYLFGEICRIHKTKSNIR